MSTSLFIKNQFVLSLEELKCFIQDELPLKEDDYEDILTLIQDGILIRWLLEGTDYERSLAKKLKEYGDNPKVVFKALCLQLSMYDVENGICTAPHL